MRYDCRTENRDPLARGFPVPVKILDPQTGERIPNVVFADTKPEGAGPSLIRFLTTADGVPMVNPERKKRFVDNGRGGVRMEYYWDRLETYERRPWVAVCLKTGQLIAKSEDAP